MERHFKTEQDLRKQAEEEAAAARAAEEAVREQLSEERRRWEETLAEVQRAQDDVKAQEAALQAEREVGCCMHEAVHVSFGGPLTPLLHQVSKGKSVLVAECGIICYRHTKPRLKAFVIVRMRRQRH